MANETSRPAGVIADATRYKEQLQSKAHDIGEWRSAQAEMMGWMRAHVEHLMTMGEANSQWRIDHDKKDDDRIAELHRKIDSKVGKVSSSVIELEALRNRFIGAKWAAWLGATVFVALLALAGYLITTAISVWKG